MRKTLWLTSLGWHGRSIVSAGVDHMASLAGNIRKLCSMRVAYDRHRCTAARLAFSAING